MILEGAARCGKQVSLHVLFFLLRGAAWGSVEKNSVGASGGKDCDGG